MKLFQNLRSKRMFYRILFLLLSMVCVMFLISFLFIGSYISRSYERQAQESARQLLGTASEYVDLAVLDLGRAMQQLLWNTDITGAILVPDEVSYARKVEIVKALSDINAFNAGKKRDKALSLLSAWLPEAERFSREIGKQSAYIDSLKKKIGQESDYAGRLRDEKYAEELKVQKANQKIFELQRTNQQLERLLRKIPPEVLEELQKQNRNRSRER